MSEDNVRACIGRGLSVRHGNIEEGLADYRDGAFDFVILSQTLAYLDAPTRVVKEMLRVGERAVVELPQLGPLALPAGTAWSPDASPRAVDLPQAWHEKPRWQAFTVTDFAQFCRANGIIITGEAYLNRGRRIDIFMVKNLLSTTAVFVLER